MVVQIPIQRIQVPPGQRVLLQDVSWEEFEAMTTYFFPQVFPNMLPSVDGFFGAWLLWGYAIVLMTGVITSRFSLSLK